jgi:hypothetical protein
VVKNGVAVFDLTAIDTHAVLQRGQALLVLGLDGATSVIFNTDISSATLADDFLGGAAPNYGAKMIWNSTTPPA